MKKGRYGVVRGSVEKNFNPFHLIIETGSIDDLDEEELLKKVCLVSASNQHIVCKCVSHVEEFWTTYIAVQHSASCAPHAISNISPPPSRISYVGNF